ncbi:DUF3352 domain-containing protein [filamentous cyanobacterium LEGE 11480]|uniref:DUF3352 domain-containing protein n=1 Tax=Romeriopsis navalis LEGE 11480 TaxID=2777977 RepID=A0A928Z6Q5_9CYAN|nr:DUF3352 domain-containing protein [Romeriopsis navalis]MBE9032450.1 DUF3352 domain-containing protein [Romeriopsis navalis LEGE 11480]
MKRRSFFTALAAVAAVLLVLGLAGFAWLFGQSPLSLLKGSTNPNPQALVFIPKQAPAMASLMVDVEQLEGLQLALVKPDQRQVKRAEFESLRDGLLGSGLSYQRDVQPWLGDEVTLAVTTLDIDRDSANGNQPGYLMALATENSTRSREFLQLFWQKRAAGQDLAFEQYQGTQIIYGQVQRSDVDAPPLTLASAVVGNRFVLFANSPKVLRDAINNVQAVDLNLGNDPDYQKAIAALPENRIGISYLNLPQLAALSGDQTAIDQSADSAFRSLALGLQLDRQGLVANTTVLGGTSQAPTLGEFASVFRYLPSDALVALSGANLAQTWTDLEVGLQDYKLATSLLQKPILAWGKQWNLDLPQDIFAWMPGSYALSLLPEADGEQDWIFVADKATNPDYAQGLEKLNAIAQKQNLTAAPVKIGAQTISAWTQLASSDAQPKNLEAKAIGAWADLDQVVIFASSIDAMKQALLAPGQSLRQSAQFTKAFAPLDSRNNGYLYLDWPTVKPLLAERAPIVRILDLVAQPLLKNLKSLTLSGYGGAEDVHRGEMFWRLR